MPGGAWRGHLTNEPGPVFIIRGCGRGCQAGIRPYIMLIMDLPQALDARGGWQVREMVEAFAEYAAATVSHLAIA